MILWELRGHPFVPDGTPREDYAGIDPWYGRAFGFVLEAPDETTARRLANEAAEVLNAPLRERTWIRTNTWLEPALTTCVPHRHEATP